MEEWRRSEGVSESQLRSRKHGGETLGGARSQTDYQRTGGGWAVRWEGRLLVGEEPLLGEEVKTPGGAVNSPLSKSVSL